MTISGMVSLEHRSNSALFKRAEQLKRWEDSETNQEPVSPKRKLRKIKFSLGCVFLAACAAGDKEEVLRLLEAGADIDTTNVDGLTALHQACIDDNLDMVEFLVEHGADINKGDNEGWTPLHATASCGFISIANYLIEKGADIEAVNNDGELAIDISESDEMEDLLQRVLEERGTDCEEARNWEERLMIKHANDWLQCGKINEKPHSRTGATALHVAAAKGYIKVMDALLKLGADPNAQDFDGWTPLHAAAHWAQKEACQMLVEYSANLDVKNFVGQTALDVADADMVGLLEDLRKKSESNSKGNADSATSNAAKEANKKRHSASADGEDIQAVGSAASPVARKDEGATPDTKMLKVDTSKRTNENAQNEVEKKSASAEVNSKEEVVVPIWKRPNSFRSRLEEGTVRTRTSVASPVEEKPQEVNLRRTQSFESDEKFYRRYCELRAKIAGNSCPALLPVSLPTSPSKTVAQSPHRSISLKEKPRRGVSKDDFTLPINKGATSRTTSNNATISTTPNFPLPIYANANPIIRSGLKGASLINEGVGNSRNTVSAPSTPVTPATSRLTPANIFRNFFKSFVPPVRDEESETQRKAHAKRVRETRRSTQGVTLEEIKSAEQLVKKQQLLNQANNQTTNEQKTAAEKKSAQTHHETNCTVSATLTAGEQGSNESQQPASSSKTEMGGVERRPSWRLRVDNGCKFMLEDARNMEKNGESAITNESQIQQRWTNLGGETADTTVTLPLRKNRSTEEQDKEKENIRENSKSSVTTTQALIQRRKRPKRRSTGVVQVDLDEIDPNRQNFQSNNNGTNKNESDRSQRLNWTGSQGDDDSASCTTPCDSRPSTPSVSQNGQIIDYKKLYEDSCLENERLKERIRALEQNAKEDTSDIKESQTIVKNSLSESEKREKRAMERKLSEMEEELKNMDLLKKENQRLKDENGALIRVISKLSK